jgi:hypothetical protein
MFGMAVVMQVASTQKGLGVGKLKRNYYFLLTVVGDIPRLDIGERKQRGLP